LDANAFLASDHNHDSNDDRKCPTRRKTNSALAHGAPRSSARNTLSEARVEG